jgi:PKD repeat protein
MVIDKRIALAVLAVVATAACTVKDTQTPSLSGPSGLALTLRVSAIPDTISQDGGSQSSIRVTAIGPDGRPAVAVPLRVDISVAGTPMDFGTLSARTIVTGNDGTASVVFTAPPAPPNGVFLNNCIGLPGTCIDIVAAATGSNLVNTNPESALLRLVPTGVILPPATTPVPCFITSPSAVAANVPVQFTAGTLSGSGTTASCQPATSDIVSFGWNFGDGTSGTGRTITHTFTAANAFTVTLTETNDRGISGSTSQTVTVGSAALPTPTFTFSPQSPAVNEPVFFNASASTAGAGHTITSYRWTFGDGATGGGQTVSHAYTAPGDYIVQLTVTDEAGQSSTSAGTTVTIGGQSTPAPTANFTFSPNPPAIGDTVVFDWRTSTAPQGQRIVSLDWNFGDSTPIVHCPGDGACTADGITTHVFRSAGTFTVNLIVTDSAGRTSVASKPVTVGNGSPTAAFTFAIGAGRVVTFDGGGSSAVGSATIQTFSWLFGDGSSGTGQTASHGYAGAGTFTVRLTVTDSLGRSGTTTNTVTVP